MAQAIKYSRWEHPEPGTRKSLLLSLLAHSLLALMFSIGLNWKTSSTPAGVEVELWDNTPAPTPVIETPEEKPAVVVDEKAEIVTEKKKVEPKKEEPKKVEAKKPEPKPVPPKQEKPKEEPKPKPKEEPKPKPKEEPKPKPKEEVKEKPKTPTIDSKAQAEADKRQAEVLAKLRANAGAESGGSGGTSGAGTGTGGVASPGYADKVRRAIKPWINYAGAAEVEGNPAAQVAVELAPDGKIISKRLTKSSGLSDWDAAVLRAIDSAGTLPKDQNGSVPKSLVLIFRPKD
jgi:colicin import membrane protein